VNLLDQLENNSNHNNKIRKLLKKHTNSIIFLVLLTIIVSVITYYRILIQIHIGPISDSIDFFTDALVFAGHGIGYSDLLRPPLFPFITSLFIRLGYTSINTIFAVDGGLFVFGVIGMYMLLKIKFNELESFLGGLIYATFPVVLILLGFGFSDLSSISFSIWAIFFTIMAVKKDSRLFCLGFPFFMFAFLARYNNVLLILPIIFYILINRDKIKFKNFFIGVVASLIVIIPALIFFNEKFGNIIYPFINFGVGSTSISTATESLAYNPNIFYYLQLFPAIIGIQGFIFIIVIALGVLVYVVHEFVNSNNKHLYERLKRLKINSFTKIKLISLVTLGIVFLGSFDKTVYIVSEILFFVISYVSYDLTKNRIKDMDIHVMILLWFMVFFIFNSIFIVKNNRYSLLMLPSVSYFMILGFNKVFNEVKIKIRNKNILFPIFAIILTIILLLSTTTEMPNIFSSNNDLLVTNEQVEMASQWFISYDPNYKNQNIYSDLWPNFSWYLKMNVKPVPIFKNNETFGDVGAAKNNTFNQEDSNQFNNYLVNNNVDYYFCVRPGLNLTSYKSIKEFDNVLGNVVIYKRI
jgi:hypothetical protein